MSNKIIYTKGQKIRDCTFIEDVHSIDKKNRKARFKCHCGNIFVANIANIKRGSTLGCGCLAKGYMMGDETEPVGRGWDKLRLLHCFGYKTEVLKSGKIKVLENSYFDHQLIGIIHLDTIKKNNIFEWLKNKGYSIKK